MQPIERLRQLRSLLVGVTVARAALIGLVATVSLAIGAALADALVGLPLETRRLIAPLILVAGVAAGLVSAWRGRAARRLDRVALWVEEQDATPEFALVTLLEHSQDAASPRLASRTQSVAWGRLARRATVHALAAPALLAVVAILALGWVPAAARDRIERPRSGDVLSRSTLAIPDTDVDPLAAIVVRVAAPGYLGGAVRTHENPSSVSGIARGVVEVEGRIGRTAVSAMLGDDAVGVRASRGRWLVTMPMPLRPSIVRLRSGDRQRLLALEPSVDRAPVVTLVAPARDTVMREARGRMPLSAQVADDHGIASASFEIIVSSGEGESFSFRTTVLGAVRGEGAATLPLAGALRLDSLALQPGDIVHLRAVARDANPAPDEGFGTSETRTLRVARRGEYDSVAVEGAPPPDPDKNVISQRMLILLTEALLKRRPRIPRDTFVSESRSIARDQRRLRKQVGEVIFSRLGDHEGHNHDGEEMEAEIRNAEDLIRAAEASSIRAGEEALGAGHGEESPVVAVNQPLLEAYNAMWDAVRELEVAEPAKALPPMRLALAAIQRARAAERIYLRGRPPAVVVDLARVRLAGAEKGMSATRQPVAPDDAQDRRRVRVARAIALVAADTRAALDSLLLLRVESLGEDDALAAALGDAIAAVRAGGDATDALVRLRRSAGGAARVERQPRWSGW